MGKVAIFGGSFDPVHKAHLQIAQLALQCFDLKKIVFVISSISPHKTEYYAKLENRISMLKLVTKDMQRTDLSLYEAQRQKIGYSYQTLDYFHSLYPTDEICMIIGSDSLLSLPTWKNIDYLVKQYRFIVAKRPKIKINKDTKYLDRCVFIDKVIQDVSSTQIRTLIKEDSTKVTSFLDKNVYAYIIQNGLYR
ncbi:MAG: nicotinate (nicotinamide) nucleotide adenylyltransferase [Endomicrobium sp.]|jgi:nicotinate-nucleotide adenylyltransferase|nr:nicotinate (nicotinamide) nucleotide adenylyltransferase [Endomicrobium sp.]